jgi:hypothetical protein
MVRAIAQDSATQGYKFESLVMDIVTSDAFQYAKPDAPALQQAPQQASLVAPATH